MKFFGVIPWRNNSYLLIQSLTHTFRFTKFYVYLIRIPSKILTIFYSIDQQISALPGISIAIITGNFVIPRWKTAWLSEIHIIKISCIRRASAFSDAQTWTNRPRYFIRPFRCYRFNVKTNYLPSFIWVSCIILVLNNSI